MCSFKSGAYKLCPVCKSSYIKYSGYGLEKVESELSRLFPSCNISVYDRILGMPQKYDKIGNSIFLYPKPSSSYVTLAKGLKAYFQRNVTYFTTTDTTKEPGFAAPFHRILSVGAAYDYCLANGMPDKMKSLEKEIAKIESGLITFYSQRDRDEKVTMRLKKENYGAGDETYSDISL